MSTEVKDLSLDELKQLIRETVRESVDDAIEDFAALSSGKYLASIEEAREDARAGRITPLASVPRG